MTFPLETERWETQQPVWPQRGHHLLAHYDDTTIIVYQAYRSAIAEYAVRHGHFGGEFSLNRMSWIKPGFLWMMHRSGWATKPDQERILAVRLPREVFETLLEQAVPSGFQPERFTTHQRWQAAVKSSDVRVQWDPDHDPHGRPVQRRAVQLGLRGDALRRYALDWPVAIIDMTDFVVEQRKHRETGRLDLLETPIERVYPTSETTEGI
jgi:Domain of unknown function (DUF4291)